jgi:tRNA(Arg) A34 adenosine deaminase TadA
VRRGARESREVLPKEVSQIERDGTKEDDARLFAWAEAFVKSKKKNLDEEQLPFHKRDRGVVAMLVSRDGALLDCAVNTNNSNTALHAEVNLLAPWLEGFLEEEQQEDGDDETLDETDASKKTILRGKRNGRLPAGARVLVTLQCCRMCAALICAASDDALTRDGVETLREVVYAEADEGKYSNETALQSRGWERAFSREEEASAES